MTDFRTERPALSLSNTSDPMTDPTRATTDPTDAEVKRLAPIIWGHQTGRHDWEDCPADEASDVRQAAWAVLADIDARWIRVPREGAEEREEWGVRPLGRGRILPDFVPRANGDQRVRRVVTTAKRSDGAEVVVYGPWQVAE